MQLYHKDYEAVLFVNKALYSHGACPRECLNVQQRIEYWGVAMR